MLFLFLTILNALGLGFAYDAPTDSAGGSASNNEGSGNDAAATPSNGNSPDASTTDADQSATDADDAHADLKNAGSVDDLPDWAQKEIRDARSQAKKYRLEKKQAEQREVETRNQALAEQGKYKELYEGLKPEHDKLKTESEQIERYKTAFAGMVERRLKTAPTFIQDLLKDKDPLEALEYIDQNESEWKARPVVDLDAGKRNQAKNGSYAGSEQHTQEVVSRFNIRRSRR